MKKFFTLKGRLNRLRYLKYSVLLFILFAVFLVLCLIATSAAEKSDSSIFLIPALICFFCGAAVFWGMIAVSVRRLHDLNLSGWWYALVCAVSIVGGFLQETENETMQLAALGLNFAVMAFSIYLFVKKGTEGPNDYGEDLLKS